MSNPTMEERKQVNPREDVLRTIQRKDIHTLLMKAGQFHGHYCPGLALGVLVGTYAMTAQMSEMSDDMEKLLAIVETNNCFVETWKGEQ